MKKRGRYQMHGMSGSPENQSWRSMISRCNNKRADNYCMYGGRGIKVCERWLEFKNFYSDMGTRPTGTTLDRIDTNGNYELRNCRWATAKQQNNNLKSNVIITYRGETMCASDWSRRLGGCESVVASRLLKGWDIERAVTSPLSFKRHNN